MDLKEKYGIYTIPKGTLLFRKAIDTAIYETMFFSFSIEGANTGFHKQVSIQIWEITKDISAFLMLKGVSASGKPQSAIIDIYPFNKEEEYKYVSLDAYLKRNRNSRQKLIDILKENHLYNWVCTITDGGTDMEFFTFKSKEENQTILNLVSKNAGKDCEYHNSFDYTQLERLPKLELDNDLPFFLEE